MTNEEIEKEIKRIKEFPGLLTIGSANYVILQELRKTLNYRNKKMNNNGNIEMFKHKSELGQAVIDLSNTTPYSVNDVIKLLGTMLTMAQAGCLSLDSILKPEPKERVKIIESSSSEEFSELLNDSLEKGYEISSTNCSSSTNVTPTDEPGAISSAISITKTFYIAILILK